MGWGVAGVLAQRRVQRWALPAVRCGDPAADETVPNLVVAKGGADGKVAVYNNAGATHVVFDAVGWYA